MRQKLFIGASLGLVLGLLGCSELGHRGDDVNYYAYYQGEEPPKKPNNLCDVFKEKPHWYVAAIEANKKTKTPVPVMMAILYQESAFKATARPLDKVTGAPLSDAYGYAQAKMDTWKYYQKKTGLLNAERDRFKDAVNFVAWYVAMTSQQNGVPIYRADEMYLNYHEGWGGYKRGTYQTSDKTWLRDTAKVVQSKSLEYAIQLSDCQGELEETLRQSHIDGYQPEASAPSPKPSASAVTLPRYVPPRGLPKNSGR